MAEPVTAGHRRPVGENRVTEQQRFVVIGAGQAAARAAKAMRSAGFDGAITIIGSEPHAPYERPMLSKALLLSPDAPVPFVFPPQVYADLAIELRTGCAATAIDRRARTVSLADGSALGYDRLMLATGGRLRRLSIPGVPAGDILYLRDLDESRLLEARLRDRPSLAVIGGGFIGLEVAASAAILGCRVTVVEAADRLLPRLGSPEASAAVLAHHRALGIDIRLNAGVDRGEAGVLFLNDGSTVDAQVIVAGIGVVPETTLAEEAGLDVDDGVLVDEFGMTCDPLVFAAGDITRHYHPLLGRRIRLESWQNANMQAEAAGRAMAGVRTPYQEIPWLWSDQGDLNLQMAGAPAAVDRTVVRGRPDGPEGASIFQFDGERLVGAVTLNRGKDMTMIRRLLGHDALALPAEQLADEAVPLRGFIPARAAA